jgi:NAD(P)-dependent dehydrogenase (short-subunit alcohol dehydrogenase family)
MGTILIIGCSKGIGLATTQKLMENGNRVIGISRNDCSAPSLHLKLDILSDELPTIDEPLDGLVYCPGSINLKPLRGLKPEDFTKDYEINVIGMVKALKHFLPALQKAAHPAVVLYSTVAVQLGMPFHASIAAAKGAVEGITRSLAAEWAPKIRVNCIAPSITDTPLAARLLDTDDKRKAAADRHPLKTIGDCSHIAAMTSFLLSPDAAFITGQIMHIDGGMSALKV